MFTVETVNYQGICQGMCDMRISSSSMDRKEKTSGLERGPIEEHGEDDDALAKEINKLLDGEPDISKHQRQVCPPLNRSASVNLSRRRLATFGSERSLGVVDETDAAKSWLNLDSVHSTASVFYDTAAATMETNSSSARSDLNDSTCSFASFGGSESDEVDTADAAMNFTKLAEELPPAPSGRAMMNKQQSIRLNRRASYRGSLSLRMIQESNTD